MYVCHIEHACYIVSVILMIQWADVYYDSFRIISSHCSSSQHVKHQCLLCVKEMSLGSEKGHNSRRLVLCGCSLLTCEDCAAALQIKIYRTCGIVWYYMPVDFGRVPDFWIVRTGCGDLKSFFASASSLKWMLSSTLCGAWKVRPYFISNLSL